MDEYRRERGTRADITLAEHLSVRDPSSGHHTGRLLLHPPGVFE